MKTVLEIVNFIRSSANSIACSDILLGSKMKILFKTMSIITALLGGCQPVMFSRDIRIILKLSVDFGKKKGRFTNN